MASKAACFCKLVVSIGAGSAKHIRSQNREWQVRLVTVTAATKRHHIVEHPLGAGENATDARKSLSSRREDLNLPGSVPGSMAGSAV